MDVPGTPPRTSDANPRFRAPTLLAVTVAAVVLAAATGAAWIAVHIGKPDRYPRNAEVAFVASCQQAGGSMAQCDCALRHAEAAVPYEHQVRTVYSVPGTEWVDPSEPSRAVFAPCLAPALLVGEFTLGSADFGLPPWYAHWRSEGYAPHDEQTREQATDDEFNRSVAIWKSWAPASQ